MFTHNLNPILLDLGFIAIRWYSLAYIFGILFGWWYGKKLIIKKFKVSQSKPDTNDFDDLITYLIISIIIGGRLGYVFFYNLSYFFNNPIEILKIWEGGMSFHGALIGVITGTYIFAKKRSINPLFFLDIIACVSPVGIFLGRVANFINGELIGKISNVPWSVIFPAIDMMPRHPSQIYEALLEGVILFFILNKMMFRKSYSIGTCAYFFLIFYGIFRVIAEFFREPDEQIGYLLNTLSMGSLLSIIMILIGVFMYFTKKNENFR